MFLQYLQLGFYHITDLAGYDHMLFLLALGASFRAKEWRSLLILITAFTVGHSLTLGLSVLNVVSISRDGIEFLIPVTILFTSLLNLYRAKNVMVVRSISIEYSMALCFGLIHGLGFSNYLRALLADELIFPLFSFNVGIEFGQILVICTFFSIQYLANKFARIHSKHWNIGVSLLTGGISLLLVAQRIPPIS
jgi:hypothetical protein